MIAFLSAYLLVALARLALSVLNLRHQAREGARVPEVLQGEVTPDELRRMRDYTLERARFGIFRSVVATLLIMGFLFGGGLGYYDRWVFSAATSELLGGVLFFVGLVLLSAVLEIPISWYADFHIERRHGFNRKTASLFWGDWLKGTLLSAVLVLVLSAGALWLVALAPSSWWLWVSLLVGVLSVFLMLISPYVIEPLFYQMRPLQEQPLVAEVRALAQRAGVSVERILTVDASRRSSHSNAYFTGIGRTKRVVLFDTLLEHMQRPQILAILAHELGHWKKHHVLKRMLASQALVTLFAYLAFQLVGAATLPHWVGLSEASFPARVVIFGSVLSVCLFFVTPLFSAWSRHHERQADNFAAVLHGAPLDLAQALSKLGRQNLSGLHPHPWYAFFYYSHPPLPERISSLRAQGAL